MQPSNATALQRVNSQTVHCICTFVIISSDSSRSIMFLSKIFCDMINQNQVYPIVSLPLSFFPRQCYPCQIFLQFTQLEIYIYDTKLNSKAYQLFTCSRFRPLSMASCFLCSSDGYGCYSIKV